MFFQEYFGAAGNNYCQTFEMRIVDKSVTIHINEKNFELIQVKRFFPIFIVECSWNEPGYAIALVRIFSETVYIERYSMVFK